MFIIFGVFFLLAVIAYIALETVRLNKETPMFEQTTFFDFGPEGKQGSVIYREARCNSCHRALRTGTSMGLILDGIGSKRSQQWLYSFLKKPESTYESDTLDHGLGKEAAYVSRMDDEQLRLISIFLSELKANAGSSVAKVPPPERSEFIDNMVKIWAPDTWKEKYQDIRDKQPDSPESRVE